MSFGADEEILQDFLVEAGEILEQLSEQLVELESRPDDANLLNAIFRGFHTVKGGAGFLQLHELVECCHIAENVFDILRKGERHVDSELMDVILEALDAVNGMFSEVRERARSPQPPRNCWPPWRVWPSLPTPRPRRWLKRLPEPVVEAEADVTDSEFEQLLDSLNAVKAEAEAPQRSLHGRAAAPTGEDITDAEFESLLDQLHGKGQFAADAVAPAAPSRKRLPKRQPRRRQHRHHRRRIRSVARPVAWQGLLCCRCLAGSRRNCCRTSCCRCLLPLPHLPATG